MFGSADLNYVRELQATPNDPFFGRQWGLRRIFAPFAWNTATGWYPNGNSTAIGILDSGIQDGHPDLRGAIAAEYDYFNFDPVAEDNAGHGTHVADRRAFTHNGRGVAGTSPGPLLIDAKACEAVGCPDDAIVSALIDTADIGVEVISTCRSVALRAVQVSGLRSATRRSTASC